MTAEVWALLALIVMVAGGLILGAARLDDALDEEEDRRHH